MQIHLPVHSLFCAPATAAQRTQHTGKLHNLVCQALGQAFGHASAGVCACCDTHCTAHNNCSKPVKRPGGQWSIPNFNNSKPSS